MKIKDVLKDLHKDTRCMTRQCGCGLYYALWFIRHRGGASHLPPFPANENNNKNEMEFSQEAGRGKGEGASGGAGPPPPPVL